jgi:4-hydroxyphenylpyruvate dioxygenase
MAHPSPMAHRAASASDFLPLEGTDHIEYIVGNARQAAHYYHSVMGFQPFAYAGPETGLRDRASYVLRQHRITLVLTTPLRSTCALADHLHRHGDGIRTLALRVPDATAAWQETTARGGRSFLAPEVREDGQGRVVVSGIHTFGDTVHLFIERKDYRGTFLPGYRPWARPDYQAPEAGLLHVDHCVGNVGWGMMDPWVRFYEEVMGFRNILTFDDTDISTEYSALMSKVMSNGNGYVKFPINEPAEGKRKSQVEEYLDFYGGEGVQHVAMATDDIVGTVRTLRSRGLEFLRVPDAYYDELTGRVGAIDEDIEPLRELGILVDRDEEGYLLQIFSRPVEDRPTLFYEIIQRKGARSFGKGNFKALFEALEREQELRGNL